MTWEEFLEWYIAVSGTISEKGPTWGMIRLPCRQSRFFGETDDVEVVRFENLRERFPGIPHVNKSRERVKWQEWFSDRDYAVVANAYAGDIERFGYG
jgi:hypothetical protein